MPAACAAYTGASAVPQSTQASQPALQWVSTRSGWPPRDARPVCARIARPCRPMAAQAATSSSAMRAASGIGHAPRGCRAARPPARDCMRSSAQRRLTAVGSRARRAAATARGRLGVARVVAQAERHAVGGGDADQRRAAHDHVADRVAACSAAAQVAQFERERQSRLVDDGDGGAVVGDEDGAVRPGRGRACRDRRLSRRRARGRRPCAASRPAPGRAPRGA